jgi:PAS domain-containing protein
MEAGRRLYRHWGDQVALASGFRAILDTLPEAHVVLEPLYAQGEIIDFVYAYANQAACDFHRCSYRQLVCTRLLDLHPAVRSTGLFDLYIRVVQTGEPVTLEDWPYPQDLLDGEIRYYDVRIVRVGGALSQVWRDVTDRHCAMERLAELEAWYRQWQLSSHPVSSPVPTA